MLHYGVVEDRNDPEQMGRVRARVVGVHSQNRQDIPTDTLPWYTVMTPTTSPSSSGVGVTPYLGEGSWVVLYFVDEHMQDAIVLGTLPANPSGARSASVGFSSETGSYPRYTDRPDLPLSSQPEQAMSHPTMVARANHEVTDIVTATPEALGSVEATEKEEEYYERNSWSESDTELSRRNDLYPLNFVEEYEGGHIVEFNNMPGEERYSYTHPTGSYVEFNGAGEVTLKSRSNAYEITVRDKNMFVRGDLNMTVYGTMKQFVKGDYILEVEGNYHQRIHKSRQTKITSNDEYEIGQDLAMAIGKSQKQFIKQNRTVTIAGGNDTLTVGAGNVTQTITGNMKQTVSGNRNEITVKNKQEMTIGNAVYYGKAGLKLESSNNIVQKAGGKVDMDAAGNIEVTSATYLDMDAPEVDIN